MNAGAAALVKPDMENRPRLDHWRPNRSSGGWFREDSVGRRSVATVYFENQGWNAAVDRPDGSVWRCWFNTDKDARVGADGKLREYGWDLG